MGWVLWIIIILLAILVLLYFGLLFYNLLKKDFPPFEWDQSLKNINIGGYEDLVKDMEIGDCVFFFNGYDVVSRCPEFFTKSNVAHVIMVIEKKDGEVRTVESTIMPKKKALIPFLDAFKSWLDFVEVLVYIYVLITHFIRFLFLVGDGIQKHNLRDRVIEETEKNGFAWFVFYIMLSNCPRLVKLNPENSQLIKDNLLEFQRYIQHLIDKNALYDIVGAIVSVFKYWPILRWFYSWGKNIRSKPKLMFHCSGLVSQIYNHLGMFKGVGEDDWEYQICPPKEFLSLNLWEEKITQIIPPQKNYEDLNDFEDLLVAPMEMKDFNETKPSEWNNKNIFTGESLLKKKK